jgi:ABC-type lipoprotein release transport system permease subunit
MNKIAFIRYLFLNIYNNKSKHLSIFIIATLLIFILSSFLLLSKSISYEIKSQVSNQPDFIVQKIRAGKVVNTPLDWVDEFLTIDGVSECSPRVYGKHFYEPAEHYFTIVGIDLYDSQIISTLKDVVKDLNIEEFLKKQNMIIGGGVKEFFDEYHYFTYYNFRPPNRSIEKVFIYDVFPQNSNIISSDMIVMDIELAKKILGIPENESSDILLNVPNIQEWETVVNKIRISHFDTRIISKDDLLKGYENFFNYKSSIFLVLYIIVILTFILILYQRYSMVNNTEKSEIALLRSLGWSIKDIIILKISENLVIFIGAFILGVNIAYIYIFILNAPILGSIFLGFGNLSNNINFMPIFDFSIFMMMFIFFILPIVCAILVPTWKISITEPVEAMR